MNNQDEQPKFVNGELDMGGPAPKPAKEEKLPTKRFTFMDFLLTLLGLFLVGYGVYTFIHPAKKEPVEEEKEPEVEVKEMTPEEAYRYVSIPLIDENLYSEEDLEAMKTGLNVENLSNNAKLSLASRLTRHVNVDGKVYYNESWIDETMKKIFGDIVYYKAAYSYGNNVYTYNQETRKYYLMEDTSKYSYDYQKYTYTVNTDLSDKLVIKEYVAYTDRDKSWTIGDTTPLKEKVDSNNIKDHTDELKYFEYEFKREEGNYYLTKITIK